MSLFKTVRTALGIEQRSNTSVSGLSLRDPSIARWFGGEPTSSGIEVTEATALRNLTIYSIIRLLSESVASCPLILYERTDKGRREAFDSPLHDLLCVRTNSDQMSAFTFWESFTGALALGNGYAEIEKDATGRVVGLWPLHPNLTYPWRAPDGSLKYKTSDGMQAGSTRTLDPSQVLHCPLFSFTGDLGWSPIMMAKESIGASIATERFSARFFGSGSRPGGVMTGAAGMKTEQIAETKQAWQSLNGGENQGKTAFLPGDWKYEPLSLSPEESQFIESQQFNRTQLAALWRVPPHLVGDTSRLSNGNHQEQQLSFICDTIRPYMARISQQVQMKLLGVGSKYFAEFDLRERLKGDPQTTFTTYSIGRNAGFLSVNDIRRAEGDDQIGPEGDVYLVPVNYTSLTTLLRLATALPEEIPTDQVRNTLGTLKTAYLHTVRDAVSRMCVRDISKRDAMAVANMFEHILLSLSEVAADEVRSTLGQTERKPDASKAIKEHLRSISERVSTWKSEDVDTITGTELTRAVKAMIHAAHHSAAAHTVKKVNSNE